MRPETFLTRTARLVLDFCEGGGHRFAPGFRRRAAIAAITATAATRDIRTPTYLTDLGVRPLSDPSRFFRLNVALYPELDELVAAEPTDSRATCQEIVRRCAPEPEACAYLGALLDSLISFLGDWQLAHRIVDELLVSGIPVHSSALATTAGTVLAGQKDPRALDMFQQAAALTRNPVDAFMSRIRLAATTLKRFNNAAGAIGALDDAGEQATIALADGSITQGDLQVLRAVADNLRCLALLSSGRGAESALLMRETMARIHSVDFEDVVVVGHDAQARYAAQIRINQIQLLWRADSRGLALKTADDHVERTRVEHPYSLSEALSIAGEFYYQAGKYDDAIGWLRESESMIAFEASPVRLEACRKVMVAALHQSGRPDERDELLATLNNDPLGMNIVYAGRSVA